MNPYVSVNYIYIYIYITAFVRQNGNRILHSDAYKWTAIPYANLVDKYFVHAVNDFSPLIRSNNREIIPTCTAEGKSHG